MQASYRASALAIALVALTAAQPSVWAQGTAPAAKEAGTVTTATGLVFRSLKEGTGASPLATDRVKVNYRGSFPDGREFDKSAQPIEFPLNGVIKCWTEALQRMKVGGKAQLTCPPQIAYGERGAGGVIPPGATLNFDVELLGINGK
jgi:FKBP-type peptidyl-prolyl cis-trans isomerase FkpA